MTPLRLTALVVLGLALIVGALSVFTVDERQKAILFRFGEIVSTDFEPGLHLKTPFVNQVRRFDRRILTLDTQPERFLTVEKKNVIVDFFVKWKIEDVADFYRSTGGLEATARERMVAIIKDGLRAEFAQRTLQEVVTADRAEIMDVMTAEADDSASGFGIDIVDVRVKRIDLPDQVSESVFQRMRSERQRVAKQLRAEGAEAAERLRAEADRKRTVILAEAFREAEKIRGEGDARAAEIYANAYGQDADFFSFYRSMQAYRDAVGAEGDIMLLEPESEFFRYFKQSQP